MESFGSGNAKRNAKRGSRKLGMWVGFPSNRVVLTPSLSFWIIALLDLASTWCLQGVHNGRRQRPTACRLLLVTDSCGCHLSGHACILQDMARTRSVVGRPLVDHLMGMLGLHCISAISRCPRCSANSYVLLLGITGNRGVDQFLSRFPWVWPSYRDN